MKTMWNRLAKSWGSLGHLRKAVVAVIAVLVLASAGVGVLSDDWTGLILGLLGGVCAVLAVHIGLQLRRLHRRAGSIEQGQRRIAARQERLRSELGVLGAGLAELKAMQPDRSDERAIGLLREQVGQTYAQFNWLANGHLAQAEQLASLDANVEGMPERTARLISELPPPSALVEVRRRLRQALDGSSSNSLERRIIEETTSFGLMLHEESETNLPAISAWSMSPQALHRAQVLLSSLPLGLCAVELGSGTSTAWLASALRRTGGEATFVSVEHDLHYLAETAEQLRMARCEDWVRLVHAPLTELSQAGVTTNWYSIPLGAIPHPIGLLIVDGPPAGKEESARYPAVPALRDQLADEATILLDDADRHGESEVLHRWLEMPEIKIAGKHGRAIELRYARGARHV